ncbi:MAG TPA: Bax inhibitor-1/YccA family protein [Dongiaceae bacterium]|jgi:FtsH-binding integral membrane protein|nr:Bax inhibitor-1/YccA family protein [Dongiaceae bacterium]
MAIGPENRTVYRTAAQDQALGIDQGLRSYMLQVYNYMGLGLGISGVLAYLVASGVEAQAGWATALMQAHWLFAFIGIGLVFFLSFGIQRMKASTAFLSFVGYSAVNGIWLAPVLLVYTHTSVASTFFIAASMFLATSLYGYTTKRDLSGIGSFLIMGLFGLIIASVVNIFLGSSALGFAISVIGVLLFTGLTAYDTQNIKEMYYQGDGYEVARKKSIMGALRLYLDFINLFLFLLQFLGNRR